MARRGSKKFFMKVTFLSVSNWQNGDKVFIFGAGQLHIESVFSISNYGMEKNGVSFCLPILWASVISL